MKAVTRIAVLAAIERRRGVVLELVQGGKGDRGDSGPRGERGERGEAGPRGFVGRDGLLGPVGPQGEQGDKGEKGDRGADGPQGSRGETGLIGPKGDKGEKGDKGDPGERGIDWRGSYRSGVIYDELHAVHFQGSSYIAKARTSAPPSDQRSWDTLAAGASGGPIIVAQSGGSGDSAAAPLDADLAAIAALTGTGWAKRIAANSWSLSTPTAADVGADPAGTAASAVVAHVALSDPHTQYALESSLATVATSGAYGDLSGIPSTFAPIIGAGGTQACAGNDSRLSNARTPTSHAASHKSGGSDPIKLDELAAATDVTTLNASVSAHGLLAKLSGAASDYLRGDGSWAALPGASDLQLSKLAPAGDVTVTAGYGAYVPDYYEVAVGKFLEVGPGAVMEVG